MSDFRSALTGMFGFKRAEPKKEAEPVPVTSETKRSYHKEQPARGMGDPLVVAQAQKVYNPQQPTPPKNALVDTGTSAAMGKNEGWGKVNG